MNPLFQRRSEGMPTWAACGSPAPPLWWWLSEQPFRHRMHNLEKFLSAIGERATIAIGGTIRSVPHEKATKPVVEPGFKHALFERVSERMAEIVSGSVFEGVPEKCPKECPK